MALACFQPLALTMTLNQATISSLHKSFREDLESMAMEIEYLISELERRGVTIEHDRLETYHDFRETNPRKDA